MKLRKIKAISIITISLAVVLLAALIASGILLDGILKSFSGSSQRDAFSKYNQKIYSVTAEDGKIQGYVATKTVSCGEFPSDVCLNVYYNFLIKEPLDVQRGVMTFGNMVGDKGNLRPVSCDPDISGINLFNRYDNYSLPFKCSQESATGTTKSFYVSSLDVFRNNYSLKNFLDIKTVNIDDVFSTPRTNVKAYQVRVEQKN